VKSTGKEEAGMVDYEKLAAQAKAAQDAASFASRKAQESAVDPKVFFQRVTTNLNEEMNKANVELLKRGIDPISRNHLPNFDGVIFLVFGIGFMCRVELDAQPRVSRVKAIICGPPNGHELSRKEFFFGQEASPSRSPNAEKGGLRLVGPTPQEIAQDIIAGIVIGTFN
jgi:hypothetical protein